MSAWEREHGELPPPTFVPVGAAQAVLAGTFVFLRCCKRFSCFLPKKFVCPHSFAQPALVMIFLANKWGQTNNGEELKSSK